MNILIKAIEVLKSFPCLVGVIVMLLIGLTICTKGWKESKAEAQRYYNNTRVLLERCDQYELENGQQVASVGALELDKRMFEERCKDLTAQVEALGLKLKNVQAASKAATTSKIEIQTIVRDTIIINADAIDTIKVIEWRDPWMEVSGYINNQVADLSITSRDTIYQVIHKIPKRFLFFRWGCKEIRQTMTSTNPHTQIVYTEYIAIK